MPKFTQQVTDREFEALFPDDDACRVYLMNRRWPDGVIRCPRCDRENIRPHGTRPFNWQCYGCNPNGYRFSLLVGTIFENTNVSLRKWFKVIYLMLTSKKGIAALQVHRMMGFGSYSTAHYMCHRIRAGLVDPEFRKLMGIVEADETYVGGKNKNRYWDKEQPGTGSANKFTAAGAVERKGSVVARVIERTDTVTMDVFVDAAIGDQVRLIANDGQGAHHRLSKRDPHCVVKHERGQYVDGVVHSQTFDDFQSLLKRGIMGSFHKVSRKYLPLYVAKFEFGYKHGNNPDIVGAAVARC